MSDLKQENMKLMPKALIIKFIKSACLGIIYCLFIYAMVGGAGHPLVGKIIGVPAGFVMTWLLFIHKGDGVTAGPFANGIAIIVLPFLFLGAFLSILAFFGNIFLLF